MIQWRLNNQKKNLILI